MEVKDEEKKMDTCEGSSVNFYKQVLSNSSVIFSYVFENISENISTNTSILSPICYIYYLPWRIMVQKFEDQNTRLLSIFVQCNPENAPRNWSCYARANIGIMPMNISQEPIYKQITHIFTAKENDWGFKNFEHLDVIFNPENGYCYNDSIAIQVLISADIPHGVYWDSKKLTGYIGLTNQGATCYMNSLLQTIFFTNELRRAIYCIPTEADNAKTSVAFALQRIFYDLQTSEKAACTKRLTKSFGWDTVDSFMQHDVQEFLRVLLSKIESKMKGTNLEGIIPKLFEGKMCSYIQCKNIDYKSSREETFYDIQLNIKNKKDIYESFQDYIAPEILKDDNKYYAGDEHGLQEAEKGVIFKSLPPVLHLHLMRFQYDPITDNSIKFNDRFEFYDNINLSKYLDTKDNNDNISDAEYVLHAVLVHSGDNNSGHYVVYINIDAKGNWYKFDDDVVSKCTPIEAIDHNFGGFEDELVFNLRSSANAYMLSYIKVSEIPNILKDINENDISNEFKDHLSEQKQLEKNDKAFRNNPSYIDVRIILEDSLEIEEICNFFNSNKIAYITFKVDVTDTLKEFQEKLSESFKRSPNRMRIWPLALQNDMVRFMFCGNLALDCKLQDLKDLRNPWYIFLQFADLMNSEPIENFNPTQQILLFYKIYNPITNTVDYLGTSYQFFYNHISDVVNEVNLKFDLGRCFGLRTYEEHSATLLCSSDTLDKCIKLKKISVFGACLVFEKVDQLDQVESKATFQNYYNELKNRIEICFIDKLSKSESTTFSLNLSENSNLNKMALEVGKKINADVNKVQFFKHNILETPLNINDTVLIKDIMRTRSSPKIFYQKLSLDVNELINKIKFEIIFIPENLKDEKEILIYVDKDGIVSDLISVAKNELGLNNNYTKGLRFTKLVNHSVYQIYNENQKLIDVLHHEIQQKCSFSLLEFSSNEMNLNGDEMLIPVTHFNRNVRATFGIPFFIVVKDKQSYGEIIELIKKKLSISEIEWNAKYKLSEIMIFAANNLRHIDQPETELINLEDYRLNLNGILLKQIGLDHANKMNKRSRDVLEKSLKIYN